MREAYASAEVLASSPITGFFCFWAHAVSGHKMAGTNTAFMKCLRRTPSQPCGIRVARVSQFSTVGRGIFAPTMFGPYPNHVRFAHARTFDATLLGQALDNE